MSERHWPRMTHYQGKLVQTEQNVPNHSDNERLEARARERGRHVPEAAAAGEPLERASQKGKKGGNPKTFCLLLRSFSTPREGGLLNRPFVEGKPAPLENALISGKPSQKKRRGEEGPEKEETPRL